MINPLVRRRSALSSIAVSSSLLGLLVGCSGSSGSSATAAPQASVTVTGASTTRLGSTAQYTATVLNAGSSAVTWQVNGVTGGSAATGTISTAGLYTAPSSIPSGGVVTITATTTVGSYAGSLSDTLQNPLPVAASGTATQVGSSSNYLIDVMGSGFVAGATVAVGGTAATTTVVSANEVQATVALASGTSSVSVTVANPNPGAATSGTLTLAVSFLQTSPVAAARILDQTTFGPTLATIQHVEQESLSAYLAEQFAQPTSTLAAIPTNPLPAVCLASNTAYPCAESEWWTAAITGPDQLRQRVAFALSEMFVVSTQSVAGQAIPQFHNALANDAFGNFYTIMKDVALSPAMGAYLNMLNSAKPATGQIANENFARENMQLFSLGLVMLNQDGTPQLDGNGNPVQPFTEAQVQAFARAYTGWTYANSTGGSPTSFPNNTANYTSPMAQVESAHDTTSKTLLNGTVLPAGQTAAADLNGALMNLFNHQNIAPFVCTQLIQHLVTSTPSPAYVGRVAAVFASNAAGVRGDMKSVITAILTDPEARAGDTNASYNGGHLREPILYITAMIRGLGFTNTDPNSNYDTLSNYTSTLNERPYRANSVFNFFPPDYILPDSSLNAPEFAIENTATVTLRQSLADSIVNNKISAFSVDLSNTSALGAMAANSATLTDTLGTLFMHSQMPSNMRTTIINTITPLTSNAQRVRIAVYLIITSSQYKVIH